MGSLSVLLVGERRGVKWTPGKQKPSRGCEEEGEQSSFSRGGGLVEVIAKTKRAPGASNHISGSSPGELQRWKMSLQGKFLCSGSPAFSLRGFSG